MLDWFYGRNGSSPPPSPGWFFGGHAIVNNDPSGSGDDNGTWDDVATGKPSRYSSVAYHSRFMAALAVAAERNVPGGVEAWQRVTFPATGLPDFAYYLDGAIDAPEKAIAPRS